MLSNKNIREKLSKNSLASISRILVLEEVDSTSSEVSRKLKEEPGSVVLCVADKQTAGRGRAGRLWHSPLSGNIYLSLSWTYTELEKGFNGLSLAIGVAIKKTLETFGYLDLKLKWPNDVIVRGSKLGGVLVEIIGDINSSFSVIIGVGINVNMSREEGSVIDRSWVDLASISEDSPPSRNDLIVAIVDELIDLLSSFSKRGFAFWRDSWLENDAYLGENVQVISGENKILGVSRGVDVDGALVLESSDGLLHINVGDVSLREHP